MTLFIENDIIRAEFSQTGGELISLKAKKTDIEYLWQGDSAFWGRQSPVLFPIVGRLKDDQYTHQGQTYQMTQHGFARDQEFEIHSKMATKLSFSLKSSTVTKAIYPFDFELILTYELTENQLICRYEVQNTGANMMYFSIGGHPAFNVPINNEGRFEDYYLHFSPRKSRISLPLDGAYIDLLNKTLGQTNTDIALTHDLFKNDALIYETVGPNSYSIKSEQSKHSVTLSYDQMPYVGIWQPAGKEAPFICIEPWCGIADTTKATGELAEKMGIIPLPEKELFVNSYTITLE